MISLRSISHLLVGSLLGLGLVAAPADAAPRKAAKTSKTAKAKKPPPKKPPPPLTAENKKKLSATVMADFKFGMSKDDVLAVLSKEIHATFEEKIKATTDVAQQDRYRKDRKASVARVKSTYVAFDRNKPSPWDVSIVEEEFAHGTNEAMMERWENQGGKNNRRFFFFHDGKLWKMFISLDVSILPEDKRNFDTFSSVMQGQFGQAAVEPGKLMWMAGEFDVRAIDKLGSYGALALIVEDPKVRPGLLELRIANAPPKKETNSIIKAVLDVDNTDRPDVKANSNAVDAVIKAQGGSPKKK